MNWLEKAYAKSLNKVIDPHSELLKHSFAAFLRVIGNVRHRKGSVAPCNRLAVLYFCKWSSGSLLSSYRSRNGTLNIGSGAFILFASSGESSSELERSSLGLLETNLEFFPLFDVDF